jgi:dipeptidyl aminopeptidase/acylaminoacyl peptidase
MTITTIAVLAMITRKYSAIFYVVFAVAIFASSEPSYADFSVNDYGMLPQSRSVSISPDAKHYAFIARTKDEELFVVANTETGGVTAGARLGDLKARNVYFINSDHIVFTASDTTSVLGYRNKFEASASFVMNIKTSKIKTLLNKTEGIHPAQSGLGRIVGFNAKENVVYMPAYADGQSPANNLYRVSLKRGFGVIHKKGNANTIDWFMGEDGRVLAREDYSNKKQLHKIFSYTSGKRKLVYEKKVTIPDISIEAVAGDEKALLFMDERGVSKLSLDDGTISETDFQENESLPQYLKTDLNRKLVAVGYSGLLPFEVIANPAVEKHYSVLQAGLPETHFQLMEVSEDDKKLLVRISGNGSSGMYLLYDSETRDMLSLGREYEGIAKADIGQVTAIKYKARDGHKIPSILTWPTGVAKGSKTKLPLIVLPHGGPASYDHIRFDWWAQFLARKGYLVLQPNFRGSRGFGKKHEELGNGEWGRAMQDDVSDGVLALIKAGHADAQRVCIMGASYGGYSALAGGAFSPELYRCVVAVAGVSNLPRMLSDVKLRRGSDHWVNRYWQKSIGDSKSEREKLKEISPSMFAHNFEAPVLLIHGKDDTVVPFRQSKIMHKALRKADKESELVTLKGEDHWLSKSATRLDMLKAIDAFLEKHNPS